MRIVSITTLLVLLILSGCGKVDSNAPSATPVVPSASIAPNGELVTKELPVAESMPVLPGSPVDIVDRGSHSVVVARVTPVSVRWQPAGPSAAIAFPASGFVTFSLSTAQWAALDKAQGLSVRASEGATTMNPVSSDHDTNDK